MKLSKYLAKTLLISCLILGGLGVTTMSSQARRVHSRRPRVSRVRHEPRRMHHVKRSRRTSHIRRQHKVKRARTKKSRRQRKRGHQHPYRNHRVTKQTHKHRSRKHDRKQPNHKHQRINRHRRRPTRQRRSRKRAKPNVLHSPSIKKYRTVKDPSRDDLVNSQWEAFGRGRRETVKSIKGPKVQFKTLRFVPTNVGHTHFVQSIAVTPNGKFAYLGCDAFPYLSGYTKIIRINLQKRHGGFKIGPRFYGGHGQALAYNPKNRQLWLLVDTSGPINKSTFDEISTKSLRPIKKVPFKFGREHLGDVLTFDKHGNAYNENRIWQWDTTRHFKRGSMVLYKGQISPHHTKFTRINQGIRHAPGYIIQGIATNPKTNRLYIESDDSIMSLPINKLGKLKPRDVKESVLRGHREYEGISFDQKGRAYIVMARPTEILKSTRIY